MSGSSSSLVLALCLTGSQTKVGSNEIVDKSQVGKGEREEGEGEGGRRMRMRLICARNELGDKHILLLVELGEDECSGDHP